MSNRKFRGWDKEENRMIGPIYLSSADQGAYPVGGSWDDIVTLSDLDIMQYMDCKDKNGKEIAQGDIMRDEELDGEYRLMVVRLGPYNGRLGWYLEYPRDTRFSPFIEDFERYEIIGNIYENKDLLNEKKV